MNAMVDAVTDAVEAAIAHSTSHPGGLRRFILQGAIRRVLRDIGQHVSPFAAVSPPDQTPVADLRRHAKPRVHRGHNTPLVFAPATARLPSSAGLRQHRWPRRSRRRCRSRLRSRRRLQRRCSRRRPRFFARGTKVVALRPCAGMTTCRLGHRASPTTSTSRSTFLLARRRSLRSGHHRPEAAPTPQSRLQTSTGTEALSHPRTPSAPVSSPPQ